MLGCPTAVDAQTLEPKETERNERGRKLTRSLVTDLRHRRH